MINTTNTTRVANTQASPTGQTANLQQSFSQLQSLTASSPNTFSPELLQNLYQLIQTLLRQLGGQSEQEPESQKEEDSGVMKDTSNPLKKENNTKPMDDSPEQKEKTPIEVQVVDNNTDKPQDNDPVVIGPIIIDSDNKPILEGTSADDNLKGSRGGEIINGLEGDDRLYGRQGNDDLSGGLGNDRLYGGKGDDVLDGGVGNDYLSGGRGNNQLFGGSGDDTLASRLGSDVLDGGAGNDTARIRGSIDDYSITLEAESPEYLAEANATRGADGTGSPELQKYFLLTNEKTGQTITVRNTENFRFNDARLTADELKERIGAGIPTPGADPLLPLSPSQKENLLSLFGADVDSGAGLRVVDKDGNGEISVGDEAVLSQGDASSVSQQFRTLSAEDVDHINGSDVIPDPEENRLDLTQKQNDAISSLFNDTAPLAYDGQATEYTGAAFDKDGDNKLSEGDVVKLRIYGGNSPIPNETVIDHVLTADEVGIINDDTPSLNILDLTNEQSTAISNHFDRTPGPDVFDGLAVRFTGTAIDKDGNGQLSVGDTVKLHETGGIAGLDRITDHVITADDLAGINGNPISDIEVVSGGGVSVGKSIDGDAIPEERLVDINGQSYSVGFLKGEVKNYADSSYPPTGIVDAGFGGFEWGTSNSFAAGAAFQNYIADTFPQGEPGLPDSEALSLTQAQKEGISNHFDRTPEPGTADGFTTRFTGTAIDKNGDGELGVGDVVKLRTTGGIAGIDQIRDHVLTAEDLDVINSQPDNALLELSSSQKENLFSLFGTDANSGAAIRVVDKDADGEISVGDEAVLSSGDASSVSQQFRILSAADVAKINGNTEPDSEVLNLNEEQHEAIGARFNRIPPPILADAPEIKYTGVAIDKDGDGQLGVGDVVKLRSVGGFTFPANQDITSDHVLTAADIAFIEADRSNSLLDISNGLSDEQKQGLKSVIDSLAFDNTSQIHSVFDGNSDGKLSVGDTLQISTESGGATGIGFHTLTQAELDQYLKTGDANTQARADFEAGKQKWEDTRPDNYSFTLDRSGFIAGDARKPVDLTINGNTVTNAKFADGTAGEVPDYNQQSIDDLFSTIGKALDNNAAEVRVKYNAETGLPESIFIDQDKRIADEELFLDTSNFINLDNQTIDTTQL